MGDDDQYSNSNGRISQKIVTKLPPIVPNLTANETKRDYPIILAQKDEDNSIESLKSPTVEEQETKLYDPNLYSSQKSGQEIAQQDISATDQLQNEISEFFRNHET